MGEEKVLYSVKMRSSLGGAHGVGGQHISGAERIVTKNSVEQEMISMLHRAWEHDRGAAVVDAETGERLDGLGMRGVRCSCMDCEDTCAYEAQMGAKGLGGEHPREALILASKVAAAPGTVAELCWSDDPFYVTGYVGSPKFGYGRITVMKEKGDPIGGRVFFVKHGMDMDRYVEYMQHQTVLVRVK